MKVLVTGGAGFIGSNIVEYLLNKGEDVRVLDNLSTGNLENIKPFLKDIEFIQGDIRNLEDVTKAVKGVEVISHHAALPSVPYTMIHPVLSNDVNLGGTINLLNSAKDNGVRRFIFASSSAVYGDTIEQPQHELMLPAPLSPYAVQKLASEHYLKVFSAQYGIETVCFRYFNVFGPRQNPNSQYAAVIPKFIAAVMNNISPVIYGDGLQCRDFISVRNIAMANYQAATMDWTEPVLINCATGTSISILELFEIISKSCGKNILPCFDKKRDGDIVESRASVVRMHKYLNTADYVPFLESLLALISGHS